MSTRLTALVSEPPTGLPSELPEWAGSGDSRVRFHLRAAAFCPLAQRAMVALAARGERWTHEVIAKDCEPATLHVTLGEGATRCIAGSLAMLDAIEAAHPEHPMVPAAPASEAAVRSLMKVGVVAQDRLSAVTRATESNDLDIAVHALRSHLARATTLAHANHRPAGSGLDLADVVFGPTLWRARVLDDHCETYLLSGFDDLGSWGRRLSSHPAMRQVFHAGADGRYLATLRARDAVLLPEADAASWRILLGHGDALHGAG